jgi:hypothetical protein
LIQAHTRDFSKKRLPIFFTIDEDRFDCFKSLDLEQLRRFANLSRELRVTAHEDDDEQAQAERAMDRAGNIGSIMKIVLKRESYARFIARLQPDDDTRELDDFEPIDPHQLVDIIRWLMEIYTGRPIEPSSSSSAGSRIDDGGTSSTAGVSLAGSDQLPFDVKIS